MTPRRIQLSRRAGFHLQSISLALNGLPAVKVDRSTRWGNSWKIGSQMFDSARCEFRPCLTIEDCITAFRQCVDWDPPTMEHPYVLSGSDGEQLECWGGYDDNIHVNRSSIRRFLRGKNLACWCPLPQAGQEDKCHAAVLLEIANSAPAISSRTRN